MDLASVWFFLWGLLWAVYFATGGFDLGAGMLLPFLGKSEEDKAVIANAVGPLWDGNEVWLLTAGGVTFAAFPTVYAVMFSALYLPLMLILFGLIIRGVAFEFRGKKDSPGWKRTWDACLFVGSLLPALLLGVAFANLFASVPIDGGGIFHGTILTLLTPYGLLGGLLFVVLFLLHGSFWLSLRSEGELRDRAFKTGKLLWPVALFAAACFLLLSYFSTDLFARYFAHPVLLLVPLAAVAALLMVRVYLKKESPGMAWAFSGLTIVLCTFFGVIGMYPNLIASSLSPDFSLNVTNGSSSPLTLLIMLGVAAVFVPLVIAYQAWAYKIFFHPVQKDDMHY
ncbi:MAG: cytochrome d ubiquinol oxidase subunit II [Thermodesulfobacteriota bacterium]